MEGINNILQLIGVGTLLFFCYKWYESYQTKQKQLIDDYHQLVRLLYNSHTEITQIFNKYEAEQRQSLNYAQCDPDNLSIDGKSSCSVSGGHYQVLGRVVFSFYTNTLKDLESAVILKINELNATEKGKQSIRDAQERYIKRLQKSD